LSLFCPLPYAHYHYPHSFPTRRSSDLVANSSMYDGITAFAEACILALSQSKKNKIVVSKGLHYQALQVLHTYSKVRSEYEIVEEIGRATSELQSRFDLVCRLLLEKKNQ